MQVTTQRDEFPRRNPRNAYRPVGDDGGLVVVPADSKVEVLNPVGSKIYSMLDGKTSRSEIVRAVVEEFEVEEEQARADVEQFLGELAAKNLLSGPEGATDDAVGG